MTIAKTAKLNLRLYRDGAGADGTAADAAGLLASSGIPNEANYAAIKFKDHGDCPTLAVVVKCPDAGAAIDQEVTLTPLIKDQEGNIFALETKTLVTSVEYAGDDYMSPVALWDTLGLHGDKSRQGENCQIEIRIDSIGTGASAVDLWVGLV